MSLYQPGDTVRIRSDLETDKMYDSENGASGTFATPSMLRYAGQIVTIRTANGSKYTINEFRCWWTDGMFDGPEVEQTTLEVDDTAWSSFFSAYGTEAVS